MATINWSKKGIGGLIDTFVNKMDGAVYPRIMEVGEVDYPGLLELLKSRQCLTTPPRVCDAIVVKSSRFKYGYYYHVS